MITDEIEMRRAWQSVRISEDLVVCPSCAALVMWRDKAPHRRFHTELVTALTQPELVDEPPF